MMRTYPDIRMRHLQAQAERARAFMHEGNYREGRNKLMVFLHNIGKSGLQSASCLWALAVCQDNLQEIDRALGTIVKARALDPLHTSIQRSFEIIVRRARERLAALEPPSIPGLYQSLMEAGEADVSAHLVMATHYAATSRLEAAEELLDAVVLLAPASKDAWEARAQLASQKRDTEGASRFRVEARARAVAAVPFAIREGKDH